MTDPRPLRVVHVIPTLGAGGAQSALHRLILAEPRDEHVVVTLIAPLALGAALAARGIEVHSLGLRGAASLPGATWRLYRLLRRTRPDVVQTWMYHADLIGGVVARLAGLPVVWGLRHTTFERRGSSTSSRAAARLCAPLSRWVPRRIVSCAVAGVESHAAMGYDAARMTVIPNGYDVAAFAPRFADAGRDAARRALGLPTGGRLFGMAARWDPQKDHANLLDALARVRDARPKGWRCVLLGARVDAGNAALAELIEARGLAGHVVPIGVRDDVPAVMAALDLGLLSSRFGEAFPNVLAEAMLAGTPCASTDVGDAALIVGGTGWIVPPAAPQALADAVRAALAAMADEPGWEARRRACHERVVQRFAAARMAVAYDRLWREVCG